MRRFVALLEEIRQFLSNKKKLREYPQLSDSDWLADLYFLTEITNHLNQLNQKLQGKGKCIVDLARFVREFCQKLDLFSYQLATSDFTHFVLLQRANENEEIDVSKYADWIRQLTQKFEQRFRDFNTMEVAFSLLKDPFSFEITRCHEIPELFPVNRMLLENELLSLQALELDATEDLLSQWKNIYKLGDFPILSEIAIKMLSAFGSTYSCEATFSSLKITKSKYRSRLTDRNLEAELRCAVSQSYLPQYDVLISEKDCQVSH